MYRLEAPGHSVQGALRVVTWPSVCLPLAPVPWNSLNHFNFSYWKLTLSNNTLVCGKDPNKLIFRSKLCASCLQFWNLFLFLPLLPFSIFFGNMTKANFSSTYNFYQIYVTLLKSNQIFLQKKSLSQDTFLWVYFPISR